MLRNSGNDNVSIGLDATSIVVSVDLMKRKAKFSSLLERMKGELDSPAKLRLDSSVKEESDRERLLASATTQCKIRNRE